MILHLIAAVFAGLGAAGIALFIRLITRKKAPKWIIPVFAGLGILGYQIQHEYMWFDQKKHQLPEYSWYEEHEAKLPSSITIIDIEHGSMFWRPWTYFFPMITAFSMVDRDNIVMNQSDGERIAEYRLYRVEKQAQDYVSHQVWLMNCETRETLPLESETQEPRFHAMRQLKIEAPLYQAVCETGY